MIHAFKIENDTLELDLSQILMYEPLAKIYKRDTRDKKEFAYKEFKYMYFICDPKSYCNKTGMSRTDAHKYAVANSKLPFDYKPDLLIKESISLIQDSMIVEPVEKLINGMIKSLNISSVVVDMITEEFTEAVKTGSITIDEIVSAEANISKLMAKASGIPATIKSLKTLYDEWDAIQKGTKLIRGGNKLKDSYDGEAETKLNGDSSVEILD